MEYTADQRRTILSKVIEVAVRTILRHHIHQFGRKFFGQRTGGPMGLKLTVIVARISMDRWAGKTNMKTNIFPSLKL
jgi:hypothetical protein